MSRAANIIRSGFANGGATSAYSSLQGSQAITPVRNQPPIPLSAHRDSDADQLNISPEGRDAQALLDLGNLFEQLKKKKEGALTPEQQQVIKRYNIADQEVPAHAQTHLAVPGDPAVSSAKVEYVPGSDDVRYAVGGETQINTSPASGDPQATLQLAQPMEQATLAPVSAELLQRTTAQTSDGGSSNRNIMYSRHTESSPPMWIDVFA